MIKAKKFGTFGGVFTPSILTILGVIMYMRLGWVVGNAGLINTLVIIALAHIISLSTGLSVSSIATDKKIRAGGIYYILSRSLGLPMGGSIGITLFIGTALSISLYLIGFAESFLSIEPLRDFLGLQQNIDGYRIVGTGAIVILVIIAMISTSLAIKTQYYILAAIGLSLISIIVGFAVHPDLHPAVVNMAPAIDGISPEKVFAVFFPAVTGFTAGVAMSGDLKDPKKAIPFGTMSAIITGFFIYVALAVGIAFFVNRDMLLNDTNYIIKVAWFSPFVIAGIWGATLSSALGGILGGPRILQAISDDRITPAFFAKGYGVNNEPRNALIFIFLIAEAGILIGELNVIAGIVSMFYLTSYGFINFAYYLEKWASADFRPSFSINKYIGLIGFIAAFGVMFKLDILSMFAALIIVGAIYLFLKRRQLKLEYGDVWQSVLVSLMRTALQRIDNTEPHERNWQPNIILFSGGTKRRPHLLELGKSFVGAHGMLSNFDLIEQQKAGELFPRDKQSTPGEISEKGVFTRRQAVKNVYDGIDMIARTYGFSGLEPNTVMMGWARQTREPKRFAELLNTFYDLDLNVILLGYDKRYGYGKYATIDMWFRDKSNNGNLALTLTKLLLLSDKWENAKARILIVNYKNDKTESITRMVDGLLEQMRMDAEVMVINNQVDHRPFYSIVKEESATTDLVFIEIPEFKRNEENEFIDKTNVLLEMIGTVVMVRASSAFKKLKLGSEADEISYPGKAIQDTAEIKTRDHEIEWPAKPKLASELKKLHTNLNDAMGRNFESFFSPLYRYRSEKAAGAKQYIHKSLKLLSSKSTTLRKGQVRPMIAQMKSGLMVSLSKIIGEHRKLIDKEKSEFFQTGNRNIINDAAEITGSLPGIIKVRLYQHDLQKEPVKSKVAKFYRWHKKLFYPGKLANEGISYGISFRKAVKAEFSVQIIRAIEKAYYSFGIGNARYLQEYQKLMFAISDTFTFLENNASNENFKKMIASGIKTIDESFENIERIIITMKKEGLASLLDHISKTTEDLGRQLSVAPANPLIKPPKVKRLKAEQAFLDEMPEQWAVNQKVQLGTLHFEMLMMVAQVRLEKLVREGIDEIDQTIQKEVLKKVAELYTGLDALKAQKEDSIEIAKSTSVLKGFTYNRQNISLALNRVIEKIFRNIKAIQRILPDKITVFSEESANNLANIQFEETETSEISVSRLLDHHIQNQLVEPVHSNLLILLDAVHQSESRIGDLVRLLTLSVQKDQSGFADEDYDFVEDLGSFVKEQEQKIREQQAEIENAVSEFSKAAFIQTKQTTDEFSVYRLLKSGKQINQFTQQKRASRHLNKLLDEVKKLNNFIQRQKANIWHSQSEARLLAKRFTDEEGGVEATVGHALDLKFRISPTEKVIKRVPYYYQQLFTGRFSFQPELWIGRKVETEQARSAFARYRTGYKGIVNITGEWRSGKSFFAAWLASKFLVNRRVFTITPPSNGSTDIEDFRRAVIETTGITGSLNEIFNALPDNTVMILDDLELWWEKSEKGNACLLNIVRIIQEYCKRILFITTCNLIPYQVINRQVKISDLAIRTIRLMPFNSKELQEIILLRHRTSGFDLKIDSELPVALSLSRQARLFSHLFRISQGHVGVALHAWITSIRDFRDNTIVVNTPEIPGFELLKGLDTRIKLCLIQFMIHKRLDAAKMVRVTLDTEEAVRYQIELLLRAGLISKHSGEVYEIDPYMAPFVNKLLAEEMAGEILIK